MSNRHAAAQIVGSPARVIRQGEWRPCEVRELTPDRALLLLEDSLEIGERIVACVRDVGALAGTVKSVQNGSCEVSFADIAPDTFERTANAYGRA